MRKHVETLQAAGKRVVIALWSDGSRERMAHVLAEHGLFNLTPVASWPQAQALSRAETALAVLGLDAGFATADVALITEEDILGERLVRPRRQVKRAENFIAEVTSLSAGDVVVHVDHGIGRFVGLRAIEAAGAPHDCLEIHYAGGDKLFLPVENIELLSRYGSEEAGVELDRLGSTAWQSRKARMKNRIREMAGELIKIAAERQLREAPRLTVDSGLYDEFCAGFPYEETDDQQAAIAAVLADLASGRPMDRLICGDVGFGKTEVALRAAFIAAMNGKQVAVVVPTTLLARQHMKTFSDRLRGYPVHIGQASRLVSAAELARVKKGVADGQIDIVIGTHALLGKTIKFKDLGLIVVDEEQHFGVAHKEKLKQLRAEVHVLTLTATPIPRTLQLALSGVREMSIIATPPVDRLAVRTFVAPFDPIVVREALLRERYRGGQSFYVCPRIEDLAETKAFLDKNVPEVRVAVAHGQMPSTVLEDVMAAFYDGKFNVLLSTSIVESGLDIPTANTLIVHRADMFGLSQIYQLRGRVGRAKLRAYALLTLPANRRITPQAERRLKVLQSLDTLGAGFQLASHDLDIRGAGNLLGEEQSGHIKEVGYELYQQMLEEAVLSLKAGISGPVADKWSPQITIGTPVLIPEEYVADLPVRLALYRRLAEIEDERDIEAFAAELVDRFGPLPQEVEYLLQVVSIKSLCRRANVERIEVGPKGAVLSFRDNIFANPEGLIAYIGKHPEGARVRPDMKVVFFDEWETPAARLKGAAGDIVVGTHALLGKAIKFRDLGLIVVDEEQHFGVAHKEKLKQLRAEVHVLTLTATPIPRTLQLALSGVREMSIIATPPVDRLAVRTFVSPFDPIVVREALLRERYRGGQCFYVCPRIEDLAEAKAFLDKNVPEVRVAVAHGQMPAAVLEDVMTAFYDGKFDVLLSTSIVESGLDIPTANTLIVHRADMFGLAQIYQLRGRVGRAKLRAYALLTLPANRKITPQAERRLKVLQSLDTLGAGFQLASHDLDIRGAGNLLGDEQSGHIKEVGFELYQQMLEEAVMSLKAGISAPVADKWSPQITIGTPVLIPEDYVADLPVRLALYRRLSEIEDDREIEAFGAELVDRFGPLPEEVNYLLQIVAIKALCRRANVERIEVGPKGALLAFRDNIFSNPEGLIAYIAKHPEGARVRPDMKVVFFDEWETPPARLKGATGILRALVGIAEKGKKAA